MNSINYFILFKKNFKFLFIFRFKSLESQNINFVYNKRKSQIFFQLKIIKL